jgi:hypothetical protein
MASGSSLQTGTIEARPGMKMLAAGIGLTGAARLVPFPRRAEPDRRSGHN